LFALSRFGGFMDIYEKAILLAAIPSLAVFGWFWKPFRPLFIVVVQSACSPSASTAAAWRAWRRPSSSNT